MKKVMFSCLVIVNAFQAAARGVRAKQLRSPRRSTSARAFGTKRSSCAAQTLVERNSKDSQEAFTEAPRSSQRHPQKFSEALSHRSSKRFPQSRP